MNESAYLYAESCNALRHYSSCIMHMRTLVVAQGLVVLSASAYTLKLENPVFFFVVVGFGILFTLALQRQQKNYLGDFEEHLKSAARLETELGQTAEGPWGKYKDRHKILRTEKKYIFSVLIESGPFSLLLLCFIFLLAFKSMGMLEGFV